AGLRGRVPGGSARGAELRALGEQLVERDTELADDRIRRAHRGARAARLDLRQRARRDPDAIGELAQGEVLSLALLAQTAADLVAGGAVLVLKRADRTRTTQPECAPCSARPRPGMCAGPG